ncbi:hypothetical protein [Cohnella luojiensis]|uniref:Uncharacterized protein n=1 Tax=Cohnella luojiensis TaxID=652876 RepID=A0A4Y8M6B4_9BACL|nr:hypothetical protein [Cohnella luojiensis]TFE28934.1 hypothetical protein E2980_05945 [Cohnella luojiensis]
MKKLINVAAMLTLLSSLLAACGNDNGDNMEKSPSPSMESPAASMKNDDKMMEGDMKESK